MNLKSTSFALVCACLLAGAWFVFKLADANEEIERHKLGAASQLEAIRTHQRDLDTKRKPKAKLSDAEIAELINAEERNKRAEALVERLLQFMLANKRAAIDGEAVLTFPDSPSFEHFVSIVRSRNGKSSIGVLATLEELRAVRLSYGDLDDLRLLLGELDDIEIGIDANYVVNIPIYPVPPPDDPQPGGSGGTPFRNTALSFLGVRPGENIDWGTDVTIAVIDSGISPHPTFREGQVRIVGTAAGAPVNEPGDNAIVDGHGTAVASIIAGNDSRTPGVAPAAQLLSYQLLDSDGNGDSFTLAQMLGDAISAGAEIINLSLGSYGDSQLVREMVELADQNGRLIVASTGNDGIDTIIFPAAYESVIAVGAVDAQGEHLDFSNSGEQLDLAAPGLGVDAAWPNEQRVEFSGTSASAPFVTGAIAAVMSENPQLNAVQAWNLLQQFTDEAGAPGPDPMLGLGNLNIGRLMERDQPGIYDLAVSSHYLDPDATSDVVQVTMQNRGTETLSDIGLTVSSPNRENRFNVRQLQPGQIITQDVAFDSQTAAITGEVNVSSNATIPRVTPDRIPANNLLQSVIDLGLP